MPFLIIIALPSIAKLESIIIFSSLTLSPLIDIEPADRNSLASLLLEAILLLTNKSIKEHSLNSKLGTLILYLNVYKYHIQK